MLNTVNSVFYDYEDFRQNANFVRKSFLFLLKVLRYRIPSRYPIPATTLFYCHAVIFYFFGFRICSHVVLCNVQSFFFFFFRYSNAHRYF